jgi:two-component system NtrC family sensor kinase
MQWLRHARSLRGRITASFTLIVVGGTVVSTLIGSRIITNALLEQARTRQKQGIEAARTIYRDQLDDLEEKLRRTLDSEIVEPAFASGSPEHLARALARARDSASISFLGYVDAANRQVVTAGQAAPSGLPEGLAARLRTALAGQTITSTEVLDVSTLRALDPELAGMAVVPIDAPDSAGAGRSVLTQGLVLFSALPVRRDGRIQGVLFGGVLRNGRNDVVDRVEQLLYGRETYRGRPIGTVALLLGDVWISTNMTRASGSRAIGTVMPAEIAKVVIGDGRSWAGRTWMEGAWYQASSAPIRDGSGHVVGALYVAILESPFLAARTQIMLTFLIVCIVGLGIVFALTYLLTRTMIHPLEQMAAVARRIAGGDLDATVDAASQDEIGELAAAFNNMLATLKEKNRELQEWGHTLEEKVRERTDELVAVQARMAKAEKLASIGRLAAGVAHGINNPLGGILSLTMLALEDLPADHPLRDDLNTVVEQTMRCREIVKGLLDFSRQSDARAVQTDINPVIESTLGLLERQALFDNIRSVRHLQDGLPPVLIDPGQLQEAIINLVVNAVDAMEERGELTVETSTDQHSGEVLISIRDTGKGIPPEAMPLLFEPFFTTKKVGKGTGLGLAIVHGVVSSAGGRVEVATGPGGTTFTIRLPAAVESTPQTAPMPPARDVAELAGP